ncbi:protein farnesyltransferase/geranylgeranyltransferase type-1 subunit alpha [Periplaneta americana]|uniref:protein farnesyltransferase/geranylgeranyltransferase type-1 subunit alpha n=1 Tax=Periplaneta americana TaxID=6978 RepID=UPI0037E7DDE8
MAEADSSSEELYDEGNWVFYKYRVDWNDVVPVPQDDGPYPIVAIAYSEKFRDIYDYFRAILKSCEKSERALQLTKDALDLNPANYTVWQYRREILKHLNKDLIPELQYVKEMIEENPKNYQVWHHRRVIVEWLQDPSYELNLTETILSQDAKNYHAWQHRQWVIRTFKLFNNELEYVEQLLDDDIRNNSAWNQRYFVINNTTGFTKEVIDRELEFTLNKIKKVTNNESAWNYLRGVLLHHTGGISQDPAVKKMCEELYLSGNRSPFLLAFLVDMCEEKIERADGDMNDSLQHAVQLCDILANEYDTIRKEYWNYVARSLSQRMNSSEDEATGSMKTE